jgi:hypothetical protein
MYFSNPDGTYREILNTADFVGETIPFQQWTVSGIDYNQDGLLDLFVGGDGGRRLYRNLGDELFQRVEDGVISNDTVTARGAAWADINNDGLLDLFTSSNNDVGRFFINNGDETFTEQSVTQILGIPQDDPDLNTGQRGFTFTDYDNDGYLDLIWLRNTGINQGEDQNAGAVPVIYRNNGDGTFTVLPEVQLPFAQTNIFSQLSVADYDGDGFQDLFISTQDRGTGNFLYRNTGNINNYLRIQLEGVKSNRSGIGSLVRLKVDDEWQSRVIATNNGYLAGNELIAHFGVGTAGEIDSVVVRWPSMATSVLTSIDPNQTIVILEEEQLNFIDSLALVALYDSTDGPNWDDDTWLIGSPDTWDGVFIQEGRVVELR